MADHRAERTLGAVSLLVGLGVVAMVVFVAERAWPIFEHNGLAGWGRGEPRRRGRERWDRAGTHPPAAVYHLRAWPLIYGTLLTTAIAVLLGIAIAVLSSVFIVELAPARVRSVVIPMVRLLAAVPSVIYGLIGMLVLVPFVGNDLITDTAEGVGPERGGAQWRGSRRHRGDPHGDDHADHDRARSARR